MCIRDRITVIVIGLIGRIVLENFTPFDAVYFLIVTIATVRYVDLSPVTTAGKILVIFIILTGVG